MSGKKGDGWGIEAAMISAGVAGAFAFAIIFVGVLLLIPLTVAVIIFGGWYVHHRYQTSDAMVERKTRERTLELYEQAKAHEPPDRIEFGKGFARDLLDGPEEVVSAAIEAGLEMYDVEGWGFSVPPPPAVANSIEGARYRDHILKVSSLTPRDIRAIQNTISDSMNRALAAAPKQAEGEAWITQPLQDFVPNLGATVERMSLPYFESDVSRYFERLRERLERNLEAQKGVFASEYKGDDPVKDYLKDTPLRDVFKAPVSLSVPRYIRHEHAIITGGSGHGKTTLLENLILKDLKDTAQPSIVVIDSQRALIGKLSRLAEVHERPLIIIDPKDAPALNPFAFNQQRYAAYDQEGKERVRNHTMELFGYLFDSLLGADLTTRQGAMFTYVIQAMLAMPETMGRNATLQDVIDFTERPEDYARAIDVLSSNAKAFFATDYLRSRYSETKEQVRYRLHAILGNPTIARLFLAQENCVDFFDELNQGAIILIDTDKGFLGAKNSGYLGRIAITLLLQAILERDASGKPQREVFMYLDEAGEYFDRSIESFLTEARKQRAGITLAHQHFGQMTSELRASVATNTATKYAGGLSAQDARSAAQDMRAQPDFLLEQERLSFACYIRNVTKTPTTVTARIGTFADELQATEEVYQAFRTKNRERLAVPPTVEEPEAPGDVQTAAAPQAPPKPRTAGKAKTKKAKLESDPGEYA